MNKNEVYESLLFGKELYKKISESNRIFLYGAGMKRSRCFHIYVKKANTILK